EEPDAGNLHVRICEGPGAQPPAHLDLVRTLARRSAPARQPAVTIAFAEFTPWWAQRLAGRSRARTLIVVAGRQAGKTLFAAYFVLRRAFEKPRSYSALLAPTYLI